MNVPYTKKRIVMIKSFYANTALTFLIASSCLAMNETNEKSITPKSNNFFSVAFCKDKIFLAGANGLSVYNTITKQLINLCHQPTYHIALHPQLDKLAVSNEKELAIYNTYNELKTWNTKPLEHWQLTPLTFNSIDDALYSYYKGIFTAHNAKGITVKKFSVFTNPESAHCKQITCHPTKKEFLYPSGRREISITEPNSFNYNQTITSPENDYITHAIYNPDATVIAINDLYEKCCIYEVKNSLLHLLEPPCPSIFYTSMAFHPHRNILALLTDKGAVHYWNYVRKKRIAITDNYLQPNNDADETIYIAHTKRLDFSPDGKHLAIALSTGYWILTVPCNNVAMIYYALKNYVTHDVAQLIIKSFTRVLELQHLDYFELLQT